MHDLTEAIAAAHAALDARFYPGPTEEMVRAAIEAAAPLIARRDEYHTMDELYEYRMLYNALAANAMPDKAVKSWRHSDGEECFGGGWFVVYLNLPTGQVSNHYKAEHWDLFRVPEAETAPEYDGHTPADAAQRLREALRDVAPLIAAQALRDAAGSAIPRGALAHETRAWLRARANAIEAGQS